MKNNLFSNLSQSIKEEAQQLGFAACGIASAAPTPHHDRYLDWLTNGYHANMGYLATEEAQRKRLDPRAILPECQSVIVLATPYPIVRQPESKEAGWVASYALGADYHDTLHARLGHLVDFLEQQVGRKIAHRCYVDTGPILERGWAVLAGLGWIGKSGMLLHPTYGSGVLLSEILLEVPLPPDSPFSVDRCGTCTRCVDACPTAAILPNRTIDSNRCIAYHTIENKGEIPRELRHQFGQWIFGCDVCQAVCPWNRRPRTSIPAPFAIPVFDLFSLLTITPEAFRDRFRHTPLARSKRRGILRNIAIAIGNLIHTHRDDPRALLWREKLAQALESEEDPLVRDHLAWAISQGM